MVKLFIDPGHGGEDSGATGNGILEKDLVLDISRRIRARLNSYQGIEVRMSRDADVFVPLSERARLANSWGADIFVSVHANAGGGTGFESFIWNGNVPQKTITNQRDIHQAVINEIGGVDRGRKRANFAVLRETRMPALLTENLFVDHAADAERLKNSQFLDRLAEGHANGIATAYNLQSNGGSGGSPSPPAGTMRTVQSTLNGRYGFAIAVDNIYGPETKRALLRGLQTELNRQFNAGLAVDGIWGPLTRGAVVNIRRGARGNITWILQAVLYGEGFPPGPVDGIFGPRTEAAVRSFQQAAGIAVDGIAGPQTFTAIFG